MEKIKKIKMDNSVLEKSLIYNNGELAFIDKLNEIIEEGIHQLDAYAITLCLQGKASIQIKGTLYSVGANDIFICPPDTIVESALFSVDFRCHSIYMSASYAQRILPMTDNGWDIKILFEKTPQLSLLPDEVSCFCQYYEILCAKVSNTSGYYRKQVIDTLMLAFIYDYQDILSRQVKTVHRPFTSGEYLFKSFINMLSSSYPKNRNVNYYADKLHVTPKYLSSVCKEASGVTTSKLIDQYVLKDIEHLMRYSSKSIKEISIELDFPSISFFGKYVKKHWGVSPKEVRGQFYNQDIPQKNS